MPLWLENLIRAAARIEARLAKLRLPLSKTCGMLWAMVGEQLDLRRRNLASYPVARAFALSLLCHAMLFVTVEVGQQTGLWKALVQLAKPPPKLDRLTQLLVEAKKREQQVQEIPLTFVDVDPSQEAAEPPKDAKYYSARNSRAANPDIRRDTDTPKIEGKQQRMPQTLDRARPGAQALQPEPTPPPPQVAETKLEPKPETKPEPKPQPPQPKPTPQPQPGDLAYAKPSAPPAEQAPTQPKPPAEAPKPPRARTLEAKRREKGGMAGEKMRQDGGVKRFSIDPGLDVRATPFGAYDAAIIAAIQQRWYDLLEQRSYAGSYAGKVVLEFRLNSDGSVSDMRISESDVTAVLSLLCQRAVQDPAPFAKWPPDLRRLVGKEYREVRFTFYYN